MVELYGKHLSRRDVAARAGMLSQFAGVRLVTLGDGVERGIRMLEFRTGTGLRFTVLVDRALDIADCEFRGRPSAGIRPRASAIPACTNTRGRAASPGCAPSPASS